MVNITDATHQKNLFLQCAGTNVKEIFETLTVTKSTEATTSTKVPLQLWTDTSNQKLTNVMNVMLLSHLKNQTNP